MLFPPHILPPQLCCFGKVTNYQTNTISSLFQDSQLLPITSLKAGFCCSHPNTGTVGKVQHPFHYSILYKRNYGTAKYCNKTTIKKDIWGEQRSSATDELSSWCRKYLIYTPSAEWIGWTKVSTSAQGCMALITAGLSGLHMLAEILTMRWINTWKCLPAWRHKAEVLNNDGWTSEEIIGSI